MFPKSKTKDTAEAEHGRQYTGPLRYVPPDPQKL